jgi:hypothetical protein
MHGSPGFFQPNHLLRTGWPSDDLVPCMVALFVGVIKIERFPKHVILPHQRCNVSFFKFCCNCPKAVNKHTFYDDGGKMEVEWDENNKNPLESMKILKVCHKKFANIETL